MHMSHFSPWLGDQLQLLISASTKEELYFGLTKAAALLGFDYFAYGLRVSFPVISPKIELFNNYPEQWRLRYATSNYLAVDPTVRLGMQSTRPIIWDESLFSDSRALWEDANAAGLTVGWAQSTYTRPGVAGLLTLARSHDELDAVELSHKTPLLVWFNQIAQLGLQQFLLPQVATERQILLTDRECEVIRWTADGKTAFEISMILGITERTVNFHLNNIQNKLGVKNKVAAAVQAVLQGHI